MLLPLVFRSVKKQGKTPSLPSLNSRGSWLSCLSACRFYRPSCTPCSASSASRTWSAATTFTVLLLVLLWTSVCRAQGEGVWNTQPFQDSIQAQLEALDLGQLLSLLKYLRRVRNFCRA